MSHRTETGVKIGDLTSPCDLNQRYRSCETVDDVTDLALYRSDFRETLTNVAEVGGCDLLLTSPPYGKQRVNPETYGPGFVMDDYRDLGTEALRALKPGGNYEESPPEIYMSMPTGYAGDPDGNSERKN